MDRVYHLQAKMYTVSLMWCIRRYWGSLCRRGRLADSGGMTVKKWGAGRGLLLIFEDNGLIRI